MNATTKSRTPRKPKRKRIKVHTSNPKLMKQVDQEVESHYNGELVEKIRNNGGVLERNNLNIYLAQEFGFCYGVRRAIDLAYGAYYNNPGKKIYLIGEIIHNPEVNKQLEQLGIITIEADANDPAYNEITSEDLVIVPAFGSEISIMEKLRASSCQIIDTTCGDVMTVWRRVKSNARNNFTSIIHGKTGHEETKATASRAIINGNGHYLIVLSLEECDYICSYITGEANSVSKEYFLKKFSGSYSEGFDPDLHLEKVGVANQTTMLKSETEEIQRRISAAICKRDGVSESESKNFKYFDTICGATQERQDALVDLLKIDLDMLLVVGGYNSSNTTHLVEIGEKTLPTYFIRDKDCLKSFEQITHYDIDNKHEIVSKFVVKNDKHLNIGITAGASCPDNLIEETILKVIEILEN